MSKLNRATRSFEIHSICVSAFCEATVQEPPFIARGNGGSGLVILEPKKALSSDDLLRVAAYINKAIQWRFSYGRMVTPDRLMHFEIPKLELTLTLDVEQILPQPKPPKLNPAIDVTPSLQPTFLTDIFDLHSGDYHRADVLSDGPYPLISCGEKRQWLSPILRCPSQPCLRELSDCGLQRLSHGYEVSSLPIRC